MNRALPPTAGGALGLGVTGRRTGVTADTRFDRLRPIIMRNVTERDGLTAREMREVLAELAGHAGFGKADLERLMVAAIATDLYERSDEAQGDYPKPPKPPARTRSSFGMVQSHGRDLAASIIIDLVNEPLESRRMLERSTQAFAKLPREGTDDRRAFVVFALARAVRERDLFGADMPKADARELRNRLVESIRDLVDAPAAKGANHAGR